MSFFEFPHTRTYDSDLGWLIRDYKTLDEFKDAMLTWIQETQPTIDKLNALLEMIASGNLPEGMQEGIKTWLEANALDLIGQLVKMIFFNLNDEGYLVAFIPESWSDITFGTTGLDVFPAGVDYGHLTLDY